MCDLYHTKEMPISQNDTVNVRDLFDKHVFRLFLNLQFAQGQRGFFYIKPVFLRVFSQGSPVTCTIICDQSTLATF
jgi:hypothetical protein